MDEPLSALDAAAKEEILPFLERLRDRLSLPALYVTHDMAEVERLADHLVLLENGRAIAAGPLAELQSDPKLPLAAARGAAVSLAGTIEAVDAAFGLTTVKVRGASFVASGRPGRVGERRRLRVVAGDVSIASAPPGPSSILNVLPARILSMNDGGAERTRRRAWPWRGRRRRPHPVAHHPPLVGTSGARARARASTRRSRASRCRAMA